MTITEHIQPLLETKRIPAALVRLPLLALSFLIVQTSDSLGEDHLLPVASGWNGSSYNAELPKVVSTVFIAAFQPDVRARVYTFANLSPYPEQMTFIRESNGHYDIACSQSDKLLGLYDTRFKGVGPKPSPSDYHEIKPRSVQRAISASLGREIVSVWKRELLRTGYSERRKFGVDGEYFTFSMEEKDKGLPMAGTAWSPDESEPRLYALTGIVNEMQALCFAGEGTSLEALESKVAILEKLE